MQDRNLTNNYLNAIIPHRDSIWTQNYTLAEITGILYKNSQPEPGSGTDGYMKIIKDYERYEPVLMTEIMRMLFYVQKTGLNIQGINQKRFRVEVYPRDAFY